MGRRNEHTREEIRKMAIKAGRAIIERKGFTGLSARKVSKSIGYTVGTLYNVFENFTDLVCHINSETLDDLRTSMESTLEPGMGGTQAIRSLADSYVEFARANTNLWGALFEFQHPVNFEMPVWYTEKVKSIFDLPVKYLAPLFGGDMERAEYESRIIWGGVHGICILGLTRRLGRDSGDLIKSKVGSLIENYMYGLIREGMQRTAPERAVRDT